MLRYSLSYYLLEFGDVFDEENSSKTPLGTF